MVDLGKAAVHNYSVPTHILECQPHRDLPPPEVCSLLHHSDGQQHFRTLFGRQTQWNLVKAIIRIHPMMETSIRHCC